MNQEKVGNFIKKIRNEKGLTQMELALKIGVTDRAISKWENGRGLPDISFLLPLAKELDVSILDLLNGERISDNDKAVVNIIKERENLLYKWKKLVFILINIILISLITMIIYGYFIPKSYENSKTQGMINILSDSMSPSFRVGDQIIYDIVDINIIKENDFIVFKYIVDDLPNDNISLTTVHRVIKIINNSNGISLITRGDNNSENDKYYVTKDNFIGRYNHKVPVITSYLKQYFYKFPILLTIIIIIAIGIILMDILVFYMNFINKKIKQK